MCLHDSIFGTNKNRILKTDHVNGPLDRSPIGSRDGIGLILCTLFHIGWPNFNFKRRHFGMVLPYISCLLLSVQG